MDNAKHFEACQKKIEAELNHYFPLAGLPEDSLREAMRYSLLSGGKRIRPVLTLEFCRICGGDVQKALPFACAVEMVHTYSLIHDDLPCMDDSNLRRGRPTNHIVNGEATALLAGDALLTSAFETILGSGAEMLGTTKAAHAALILAQAAGERGMVAGQILDLDGENRSLNRDELDRMHTRKTGALIEAACVLGVIAAGGSEPEQMHARDYARALGLAFQIRDDMLDVEGSSAVLGKPVGSDAENIKSTFVTCLGLEACGSLVSRCSEEAASAAAKFENGEFLQWLAHRLSDRTKQLSNEVR